MESRSERRGVMLGEVLEGVKVLDLSTVLAAPMGAAFQM